MNRMITTLTLCFLPCLGGCLSLSSTTLSGAGLRYPVSMSQSIVDASGGTFKPTKTDIVAHFRHEWGHWGMFYDLISLSSDVDLTEVLHEEIEKVKGNGIVNLKVSAEGSGFSWFVSLLLIFPEYVTVVVEGDVIQSPAARL